MTSSIGGLGIGVNAIISEFPHRVGVSGAVIDQVREFCKEQFGDDRLADKDGIWLMMPSHRGMSFYFKSVSDVIVLRLRFTEYEWGNNA